MVCSLSAKGSSLLSHIIINVNLLYYGFEPMTHNPCMQSGLLDRANTYSLLYSSNTYSLLDSSNTYSLLDSSNTYSLLDSSNTYSLLDSSNTYTLVILHVYMYAHGYTSLLNVCPETYTHMLNRLNKISCTLT